MKDGIILKMFGSGFFQAQEPGKKKKKTSFCVIGDDIFQMTGCDGDKMTMEKPPRRLLPF